MECVDCDRSPNCPHMIDGTDTADALKGKARYIKGRDCPLEWQDKKAEDMTEEQKITAIKELQKMYVDLSTRLAISESKESKQNSKDRAVEALLKTSADRENEYWSKRAEEAGKELLGDKE